MSHSRNKVLKELEKAKRNALLMEKNGNTDSVHHDLVIRLEKALAGGSKQSRKKLNEVKENGE